VTLWQHVQHGALAGIKKKKAQAGKNKDRCAFCFCIIASSCARVPLLMLRN
jgi:hypothetical protein